MTDGIRNDEPTVDTAAEGTAPDADRDAVSDVTTDQTAPERPVSADGRPVQYGVGPFSLREVVLGGLWLLAFIVSFFSISTVQFASVWTTGLWWILTIGAPTVAVFLLALRRLSPEGIRRVGSLGIDQFASVAFTVSAVLWLHLIWETVGVVVEGGPWLRSWVIWVEFFLMLGGVILTVFAPIIPPFSEDFRERREVVAHRLARPVRPVAPRPRTPKPARPAPSTETAPNPYAAGSAEPQTYDTNPYGVNPYAPASAGAHASAGVPVGPDSLAAPGDDAPAARREENPTERLESLFDPADDEAATHDDGNAGAGVAAVAVDATREMPAAGREEPVAAQPEVRYQAFWALVPEERDVVDEFGTPLFRIGPTAWALVIEDRQTHFVVRHEDGRTGYLRDVSGVTRG